MNRIAILILVFLMPISLAAQSFSIVAIVNDGAISNFDLHKRISFIINSSGLQNTSEVRSRIAPKALQSMVNELLQRQEAEKYNIAVNEREFKGAISEVENKNKIRSGDFDVFIEDQGLEEEEVNEQMKAQLLWQKMVSKLIHPNIIISDYEIKDVIEQLSSKKDKEVYLSEIFLSFSEGMGEEEVLKVANNLVSEIKNGKSFGEIAKQFSSSNTAANGGDIGWTSLNKLGNRAKSAIKDLKSHEVTKPIKSKDGYRIIKIGNSRDQAPKVTEARVRKMLMLKKLDLASRKFMKELRAKAFIEIKL